MSYEVAKVLLVSVLSATVLASTAYAQKKYDTGASDTEIKIGNAMPYSGPASPYGVQGKVIAGYVKMINERGGINGRRVTFLSYDDQYSPPKTVEMARRLVEQDEVLGLFAMLGSGPTSAINRYVNARKVPNLFASVGTAKFNDPKDNPWTVPFLPSYQVEGRLYAQHILKTKPDAKIAVLFQNDDFGKDLLKGLRTGLGDKAKDMLVSEVSYEVSDPQVDSQVVQMHASGANVVLYFTLARAGAQAIRKVYDLGWRPQQQYMSYVAAFVKSTFEPAGLDKSAGVMSLAYVKDPAQSRWEKDPETKEYTEFMKKYVANEDPLNGIAVAGYLCAQAMEHTLRQAGDQLTRENLLRQATTLKDVRFKMMLPGLTLSNSSTDYSPYKKFQLLRFNGKEMEPVGEVVSVM
jgi:branched-chain amino acid transport system substrate-binding protein